MFPINEVYDDQLIITEGICYIQVIYPVHLYNIIFIVSLMYAKGS